MTDHVGSDQDAGTSLNGTGTNAGSVTTAATGLQTVAIKAGTTTLDEQEGVNVTNGDGGPPVGIDSITSTTVKSGTTKTFTVNGKCNPNVTPNLAFVLCLALRINPNDSSPAPLPVVVGFDVPKDADKNWQIKLRFDVEDGMRYVARAFLFDCAFHKIGSFTKVLV
jgi:hypothetical protein